MTRRTNFSTPRSLAACFKNRLPAVREGSYVRRVPSLSVYLGPRVSVTMTRPDPRVLNVIKLLQNSLMKKEKTTSSFDRLHRAITSMYNKGTETRLMIVENCTKCHYLKFVPVT